jgi:hypothetical protein
MSKLIRALECVFQEARKRPDLGVRDIAVILERRENQRVLRKRR